MTSTLTHEPLERTSGVDDLAPHDRHRSTWAIIITGLALFMASLDNLVVTTALPVIRVRLHAGLSGLEWTVNAYTGCTVTSAGSFGIITSNTATVATISAWVGGTPPVGGSYTITSTPAGTADLTATFGNQLVAGAVSFTAAQP